MLQLHSTAIGKGKKSEAATPCCNTGAPRTQIGGEIQYGHDWITVSFKEEILGCTPEKFAVRLLAYLARSRVMRETTGWTFDPDAEGALGYEKSAQLLLGESLYGRLDWGGKYQRGWCRLDITGKLCKLLPRRAYNFLFRAACKYGFRVNRCDIALDDFSGTVFNVQDIDTQLSSNRRLFLPTYRHTGFAPTRDWIESDTGKTLYINRQAVVGHCIYEKGGQLEDLDRPNWVRWEVRFRRRRKEIELEAFLLHPDYLLEAVAGSSKHLANLLSKKGLKFTMKNDQQLEEPLEMAAKAILNVKRQYGGVLPHLVRVFGSEGALRLISRPDAESPLALLQPSDQGAILERLQQVQQQASEAPAAVAAEPAGEAF